MGDATPGPKTDPEYTDIASCISNPCSENPRAEDLRSSCNAKNTANTVPQVVFASASVSETVNVATPDDGFVHNGQVQALQKPSYAGATSDRNETVDIKEAAVCLDSTSLASLDPTKQKCLTKCATFPFSNEIQDGAVQDSAPTAGQSVAYERSISLPTSLKLVSAMKGGRAKDGTSPTTKFHVKWAPDVYDPPMTSVSHTAKKSYQQRSKPKRKNHKQKNKAKSSRGGANERKQHLNGIGGTSLPRNTRLQAVGDRLLLDEHGKSTAEVLEYAKESKCGSSSFLREALAKMHFSTAEAS